MKRFCTSYTGDDGFRYTDTVDATDWEHAQAQCDARRPGEKVDGVLYLVIDADSVTIGQLEAMAKAMAETGYSFDDAPEASEFDQ